MKWCWILLLISSPLHATFLTPWFSPLWELEGYFNFHYDREHTIQSPRGSFSEPSSNKSLHLGLGVTPWPYWNTQIYLLLTETTNIPFSYEAFVGTVRYQWLDDVRGDPMTLVTGITLSFPGTRYLRDFSFAYHGEANGEVHLTVGKEWAYKREWWMRMWALGGWGIANRGNGWIHGLAALEFRPNCFEFGLFSEALYGLGPNDIIPEETFDGYASIDHRSIDIGGFIQYKAGCIGTLSFMGWYNVYARNFVEHRWGINVNLLIPFSL